MKYGPTEIKDLTDLELIQAAQHMEDTLKARNEAASHPKFQKIEFPPVNPNFLQLQQAILTEIASRDLKVHSDGE